MWLCTCIPVLDAADPLLDDGLDGVRGELLLGHAAVVASVDPAQEFKRFYVCFMVLINRTFEMTSSEYGIVGWNIYK